MVSAPQAIEQINVHSPDPARVTSDFRAARFCQIARL